MKQKTWLIVSVFAAVVFVLGFVGCDDDDDTTSQSYTHSIQYSDRYQAEENEIAYSILQSADGREALDVKEIGDAPVIFTDIRSDRVTVTTITTYLWGNGEFIQKETMLTSYVDVPVGLWYYGTREYSELGNVSVSVSYPEDSYEYLYVVSQTQNGYVSTTEQMMWYQSSATGIIESVLGRVEDRTISVVAILGRSNSGGAYYAGVLKDQPFQPFGDNQYNIELTDDFTESVITSSPANSIIHQIAFYLNGKRRETYIVDGRLPGTVENGVRYPSALESELCGVQASLREGNVSRHTTQFFQGVPSSVTVPDGDVNFVYDSAVNRVADVTTNTDSKVMLGSWSWHALDTPNSFRWDVYASVDDEALSLPQLPDSIYSLLGFDDEDMLLGYVSAESYNTVSSYDDYIKKYLDSTEPGWIEYDTYSSFTKFTGLSGESTDNPFPDTEYKK